MANYSQYNRFLVNKTGLSDIKLHPGKKPGFLPNQTKILYFLVNEPGFSGLDRNC